MDNIYITNYFSQVSGRGQHPLAAHTEHEDFPSGSSTSTKSQTEQENISELDCDALHVAHTDIVQKSVESIAKQNELEHRLDPEIHHHHHHSHASSADHSCERKSCRCDELHDFIDQRKVYFKGTVLLIVCPPFFIAYYIEKRH